jgi:hypothetical protein
MDIMRQFICAAFLLLGICFTSFSQTTDEYLITSNSVGPVRLGMTLAQVRKAAGRMKLKKGKGIEGIPAVEVMSGSQTDMVLYFKDNDGMDRFSKNASKIYEFSKVEMINVLSDRYQTSQGVRIGTLLAKAEKQLGKLENISHTEPRGENVAVFKAFPNLMFSVSGNLVFKEGERTTQTYKSNSKIDEIFVRDMTPRP